MKKTIPLLKDAVALPDYKLLVSFEDNVSGVIDLISWKAKGVFEYWNDEKNFQKFSITPDKKITWNEDIDMDPDAFYLKLTGNTFDHYAGNQQLLRDNY
jgi:hypothetical protein